MNSWWHTFAHCGRTCACYTWDLMLHFDLMFFQRFSVCSNKSNVGSASSSCIFAVKYLFAHSVLDILAYNTLTLPDIWQYCRLARNTCLWGYYCNSCIVHRGFLEPEDTFLRDQFESVGNDAIVAKKASFVSLVVSENTIFKRRWRLQDR